MKTILLLEDESITRNALRAILQLYGYGVLEAATGAEAIQICTDHHGPIDLLIADVQLPDFSGTAVAFEVVKHCPKMPVLFISGTPMEGWRERDLKNFHMLPVGMVNFLPKPFQSSVLAARVEALLNAEAAAAADAAND